MKKSTAVIMIAALALVCLFPVCGRLLPGSGQAVTGENRALSRFPDGKTPLADWPGALEDWFEDRLAFRSQAISFTTTFQLSDIAAVLEGKDGWLYYMGSGSRDDLLRRSVLGSVEKNRITEAQAEAVRQLGEAGAAYCVLICPDKQTIYPEYLPDVFRNIEGESRLEQLLPLLREIPGLHLADTCAALLAAKGDQPLFYMTDTHWNQLGAWTAGKSAYAVFREALPGFGTPTDADAVVSGTVPHAQGDLANMLNRENMADCGVTVTLPEPQLTVQVISNPDKPLRDTMVYENPDHPELPRAVIFHDSFGEALRPYIAACFSRAVFISSDHVRMDVIREEQPDLVILEAVERLCVSSLAVPPSE